jgi:hypothetical protein
MSEKKRITSIKKVSLAGLSHEWDESCYAYVIPANYEDNMEVNELITAKKNEREQIDYQTSFVKCHFVSGKIKAFNGADFELTDMTEEDTVASVAIADRLYSEIMGFDLDPKDLRKAVIENALQTKSESNTATTSSEDSQSASPAQ